MSATEDIRSRLEEWRDQLVKLEWQMDDGDALSPEMKDLLGEDIELTQRRIRELELAFEFEETRREIDELAAEKGLFACSPDEAGY